MISWRLGITFCIVLLMILGIRVLFGPSFPKVLWCPKYTKTGETLPSNEFYTRVSLQLMWNVEFNTFDEFLYIQAHDLEYLGPISWTFSRAQNTLKYTINQPSNSFYIWVRFHLMWNVEFNCLDDFLCMVSLTWGIWIWFSRLAQIRQIY